MAMLFGFLGRRFSALGGGGKTKPIETVITGPGGIGSPMGLLFALTKSS
jgi:hypothetical protein